MQARGKVMDAGSVVRDARTREPGGLISVGHSARSHCRSPYHGEMTQPSPIPSSLGGRLCLATSLTVSAVEKP